MTADLVARLIRESETRIREHLKTAMNARIDVLSARNDQQFAAIANRLDKLAGIEDRLKSQIPVDFESVDDFDALEKD